MNLYFRLLVIILKILFTRQYIAPHEVAITRFRVLPNDLDFNLHMNNGRYLTLMDLARLDYMGQVGIAFATMKRMWFPILGETQMSFFKPLNIFDQFEIHTQIVFMDDKWIVMTQNFMKDGKLMASGRIRGLLKSKEGVVPPKEIMALSKIQHNQMINNLSPSLIQWVQLLDDNRKNNRS